MLIFASWNFTLKFNIDIIWHDQFINGLNQNFTRQVKIVVLTILIIQKDARRLNEFS